MAAVHSSDGTLQLSSQPLSLDNLRSPINDQSSPGEDGPETDLKLRAQLKEPLYWQHIFWVSCLSLMSHIMADAVNEHLHHADEGRCPLKSQGLGSI